eukprot:gene19090-21715_t
MSENLKQFTCPGVYAIPSVASTLHHLRSLHLPVSNIKDQD